MMEETKRNNIKVLEKPLSLMEMLDLCNDELLLSGNILMDLSEFIDNDLEYVLDIMSERLTGTPLLTDINYTVISAEPENMLVVCVEGGITEVLSCTSEVELDEFYERTKGVIIAAGDKAISDFIDEPDFTSADLSEEDLELLLDDSMSRMSDDLIATFYKKYAPKQVCNDVTTEDNVPHILIECNGFEIDTTDYPSYTAAYEAMARAYTKSLPEKNDEFSSDQSYLSEMNAIAYINGEDVYVWKIIKK